MASIYLTDILIRNGFDPSRVKLIRHSLKDKVFNLCYKNGFMEEYQKIQNERFFNGCDYILSFISEPGTSAKFMGCYSVGTGQFCTPALMPKDYPAPDMFNSRYYFELDKTDLLSDLIGRLIIDWGKGTIKWDQWATNEKAVLAIQENLRLAFNGYEDVLLSYGDLYEIVKDSTLYENWHTALSSVNANYLISDTVSGKLYVGSAYGTGGLLSRWRNYIDTKHGGNKGIISILESDPDRFESFQFTILQVLPKTLTADEVIGIESLYKRKLLSMHFGMNEN